MVCDGENINGTLDYFWNFPGSGAGTMPADVKIEFEVLPASAINNPVNSYTIPTGANTGSGIINFSIDSANIPPSQTITINASYKVPDDSGKNRTFCCNTSKTVKLPDCREKTRGMTWGFGGLSDRWAAGSQSCIYAIPKLACITHPINDPQSNFCSVDWPTIHPGEETELTDNGTRQCDPYIGDTECTSSRHVLCISEPDNPYFHHLPPYDDPQSGLSGYSPYNPPPFTRLPYKLHPPVASGFTQTQPDAYYDGWVDQYVKLSRYPVIGTDLSLNAGDEACGPGWRMARFDDGKWIAGMDESNFYGNAWPGDAIPQSGGWAFHSVLAADANLGPGHHGDSGQNRRSNFYFKRYWVHSTLGGNCY